MKSTKQSQHPYSRSKDRKPKLPSARVSNGGKLYRTGWPRTMQAALYFNRKRRRANAG